MNVGIEKQKVGRLAYLDNLKGFLILLVVLGHCLQDTGASDENLLFRYIYSFHMPLFMAVSGFASCPMIFGWGVVRRRARQLLLPFAVWAVVKSLLKGDIGYVETIFLFPDRGLWFLWALFFIVLIFTAVGWLTRHRPGYFPAVVAMVALGLVLVVLVFDFKWLGIQFIGWQFPFFLLGLFCAKVSAVG